MPEPWPFVPLAPLVETLEWRTAVLASRESEQRVSLLPMPRVSVEMRHRLDAEGYARAVALLRANVAGEWSLVDWRRGDAADDGPTVAAILAGSPQIDRERRGRSVMTVRFLLRDAGEVGASPYPTYLGAAVMTDRQVVRRPLAESVRLAAEFVDHGAGPVALEPTRAFVQQGMTVSTVDHGPAARDARRAWLMSVRGRQASWWLPSWGGELVLQSALIASDTILPVEPVMDVARYVGLHVMLDLPGAPIFREVLAATDAGGSHWLTIAAPGAAVPQETMVHVLNRVRFDADRIELRHLGPRTEMSAPVLEVPA